MNFNIAIRTMTVKNQIGYYSVGGGIVWDSDPIEEWKEAQLKSKILQPFQNNKNIKLPKDIRDDESKLKSLTKDEVMEYVKNPPKSTGLKGGYKRSKKKR